MAPIVASEPLAAEGADAPVGSAPLVLHLAALSGVLACLMRHFRTSLAFLPLLAQPLGSMPVGTWAPDSPIGQQGQAHSSEVRAAAGLRLRPFLDRRPPAPAWFFFLRCISPAWLACNR